MFAFFMVIAPVGDVISTKTLFDSVEAPPAVPDDDAKDEGILFPLR